MALRAEDLVGCSRPTGRDIVITSGAIAEDLVKRVKVPGGWCPTCSKQALDSIDKSVEAEETLALMKRKMLVAFMIGDKDGAIAECCYHLDITPGELSVAGPFESPKLDRKMAFAIAVELSHKFPDILEELFDRMGLFEKRLRREEESRRRAEMMNGRIRDYDFYQPSYILGADRGRDTTPRDYLDRPIKPAPYIPPHNPRKPNR